MSAAEDIGMAADAEALNLADEVRRILADGLPRTTRQIADLSRLTGGGDDVSKTVYLLRMRGEVETDVVDGARQHRLIPGGAPAPREPARPVGARRAAPSRPAPPQATADACSVPPGTVQTPVPYATPAGARHASPLRPNASVVDGPWPAARGDAASSALQMAIDATGAVALLRDNSVLLELTAADTRRLADFLARTTAVWSPDSEPAP